jgi:hypothetical protein
LRKKFKIYLSKKLKETFLKKVEVKLLGQILNVFSKVVVINAILVQFKTRKFKEEVWINYISEIKQES